MLLIQVHRIEWGSNHMTCQLVDQHPWICIEHPLNLYWVNEIQWSVIGYFCAVHNQTRNEDSTQQWMKRRNCSKYRPALTQHANHWHTDPLEIKPNWGLKEAVNERNGETALNTSTPKPGLGVTKAPFNNFSVREIFKFANVHVHIWSHPSHYPVHPPTPTWFNIGHGHGHEWLTRIDFVPCQSAFPFLK